MDVTHIKLSVFDFNPNITKGHSSHKKYYVVNNHYTQKNYHHQRPPAMTIMFPWSEAQNNVSIRVNHFCIVLKVTDHDRGSVRDGPQQK